MVPPVTLRWRFGFLFLGTNRTNRDNNHLLGLLRGCGLGVGISSALARRFVGTAFGAASGLGADAAAEIGFDLTDKGVVAEGPAGSGVQAYSLGHIVGCGNILQRRFPFARGHLGPCAWVEHVRSVPVFAAVHRGTGPRIVPRILHEIRPNRIQFNIRGGVVRMRVVQRARVEAALPEVAQPAVQPVDVLRVHQVRAPEAFGERGFVFVRHH